MHLILEHLSMNSGIKHKLFPGFACNECKAGLNVFAYADQLVFCGLWVTVLMKCNFFINLQAIRRCLVNVFIGISTIASQVKAL